MARLSKTDKEFVEAVAEKVAGIVLAAIRQEIGPDLVDTEEAARILSISPSRLRHIKDRFPHVKVGGTKQGKLLFKRSALMPQYVD